MVTQNLNQTGLKRAISSTIDHATRQQILDYLISAGIGYTSPDDGATIPAQEGAGSRSFSVGSAELRLKFRLGIPSTDVRMLVRHIRTT
ncbi:hypothetical protein ACVW1C_001299 [Bradyrhizobium sp. USDA 4011]